MIAAYQGCHTFCEMDTGWKDSQTCCTEKKEMFEKFLVLPTGRFDGSLYGARHLFGVEAYWSEPRALIQPYPIRINHSQGILAALI